MVTGVAEENVVAIDWSKVGVKDNVVAEEMDNGEKVIGVLEKGRRIGFFSCWAFHGDLGS